jgi:UDP-N-acetylglucosamine 3-dehydrogenase
MSGEPKARATGDAMQTLGICVIGAGDMGNRHLDAWKRVEATRLVATSDVQQERAETARERVGAERAYRHYQDAIEAEGVDVVSVCVPSSLHADVSVHALRAGKHVLCEKPAALTLEDADRMAEAAAESPARLAFGFCRRFGPEIGDLRQAVSDGEIGRPLIWRNISGIEVRYKPWIQDADWGGGPVIDVWCHQFDLCRLVFGGEAVRVSATGAIYGAGKRELAEVKRFAIDTASAMIEFDTGDMGLLSVSWGLPRGVSSRSLDELLGPDGVIRVRAAQGLTVIGPGGATREMGPYRADLQLEQESAFARHIRGTGPPLATIADARKALELSLACLASIQRHEVITLGA